MHCSMPLVPHRARSPEVASTPPQHGAGTMAFSRQIVNNFSGTAMSRLRSYSDVAARAA
jgi:hypothetical protein